MTSKCFLRHIFTWNMLEPSYITGFTESAGSFTFSRNARGLVLYFAIKVPGSEHDFLEKIRGFFGGVGKIYRVAARSAGAPPSYYRVCRLAELWPVVNHFDRYPLRTAKAKAFQTWRQMFVIRQQFRKPQSAELTRLAAELSSISALRTDPNVPARIEEGHGDG